jgi:hypothetical protein
VSTSGPVDCIGVGIDTAPYGHCVSFVKPDRRPAAKPLTVMETRAGYQALEQCLEQCTSNIRRRSSASASTPPASMHQLARESELIEAIDRNLELLFVICPTMNRTTC